MASARASSRRLRWPVESVRAGASAFSPSPTRSSSVAARAPRACRTSRVRVSAPTITLSSTVSPAKGRSFWNVRADAEPATRDRARAR